MTDPAWLPWAAAALAVLAAVVALLALAAVRAARAGKPGERDEAPPDLGLVDRRLRLLESAFPNALSRTGLVRFDAFPGGGGQMSFAVALLDQRSQGVLLTAISGRDETRLYAKGVREGRTAQPSSPEEMEALRLALSAESDREQRSS